MSKFFVTALLTIFSLSNQVWALNDLSYFFKRVENRTTNIFWYTHVTDKIFVDLRYDFDWSNTLGAFVGKFYGNRNLNITPAVGLLRGDYEGVSAEAYVGGGRGKIGFFSLYQLATSTDGSQQPDWGYQWMDVTYQAHFLVKIGVGEQVYHEFSDDFDPVIDIGPTALVSLGQLYLKPWYTFSLTENVPDKLILGLGYRW